MKRLKKIVCGCLSAAIIAAALITAPAAAQAAAPKLNKTSASLTVGKKLTLKVQNVKKGTAVKWSSNKKKVATVSSKGVVTAKAAGTAKIKAVVSKKTLTCTVKVTAKANTQAKDISALLAGKSYKGTAVTPMGNMDALALKFGSDGTVTGSKLNETTLALEEFSGTYKAVLSGKKATITVTAGGKTVSYVFTVEKDDYSKLSTTVNVMGMDIKVQVEEVTE